MSLKETSKELFTRYGLTEEEISVYIKYLGVPQATISEVFMYFEEGEIEYSEVEEITKKLVESNFLQKVEGIVDRYVPLEPFFELFTSESEAFRQKIATTKDNALSDQSSRFEKLESIQNKSIEEVETAVDTQVKEFFQDSDDKNASKKERINKATTRFTETSKTLEKELHDNIEKDFSELDNDLKQLDTESHQIIDTLVSNNETSINAAKSDIDKIITDLLGDFSTRVSNLETELKKDLDDHVDRHQNIANELKPKMEQILEKYLERMDKIVTDLKERISRLLADHTNHVKSTTSNLESDLHTKVENRHLEIKDIINSYKNRALKLLENLITQSNKFSDLAEAIPNTGFFFGKKKKLKYINAWKVIETEVADISRPFKDDFVNECEKYIKDTQSTSDELKKEVSDTVANENQSLGTETTDLDKRAQETITAELDTLATDMSGEIDNTLQTGVKDCSDTTVKLKDSLENSLKTHHKDYDDAINKHKDGSLKHYTDFDAEIKTKSSEFKDKHTKTTGDRLSKIRSDFDGSKSNTSEKIDAEINLWNEESADMDQMLADMLENHKNKYKLNAETLQNSLSNTTRDTTQNVKDAIADFTLNFMNAIDDVTEAAETNETKLKDVHNASASIPVSEIAKVTTWHTVGKTALIAAVKDAIYRTKSSVIVVTPVVVPEILQVISEFAYERKVARFMITTHWDLSQYQDILKKMMQLGNIQFRNLNTQGAFFACSRDAEEVILAPYSEKDSQIVAVISNQEQYCNLYSQIIGPVFTANSRPVKL
ncbi:MAG: hypothetical protein EU540_00870 [Promethearchaeota archaeon]|nr:MAG: hypothetical protein EU540_00870 [Candidatus Lokiarchaeota archaeon]